MIQPTTPRCAANAALHLSCYISRALTQLHPRPHTPIYTIYTAVCVSVHTNSEYLVALPMAVLCVSFGAIMCYLISHVSLRYSFYLLLLVQKYKYWRSRLHRELVTQFTCFYLQKKVQILTYLAPQRARHPVHLLLQIQKYKYWRIWCHRELVTQFTCSYWYKSTNTDAASATESLSPETSPQKCSG
jgi:hypothetical protein